MSVIGRDEIRKRIEQENLLENLSHREMNGPEGIGVDLRLGAVHQIVEGGAFIEADGETAQGKRKGVTTEQLHVFDAGSDQQATFEIKPGEFFLVSTIETVNTPRDLMPIVYPRSSLFRAGLNLLVTKTDPGYKGQLTFGLVNTSQFSVTLQLGARICNIVFFKVEGSAIPYRGQHQGGRITPTETEQQV